MGISIQPRHIKQRLLMQFRFCCMLLLLGLFSSCAQKLYQKNYYSFYDEGFTISPGSAVRTDGVYVLDRIWTDENGGTTKQPKEHRFYKFYATGQSNLTLDPENSIKTDQDYITAVKKDFIKKDHTLFEGYFKQQGNKLIIQSVVVPRKQFEYKYGYVEGNNFVIVKSTHEGKGKFDDKYFTDYYKEYYVFHPLNIIEGTPQW